jgi:hypothetical protein
VFEDGARLIYPFSVVGIDKSVHYDVIRGLALVCHSILFHSHILLLASWRKLGFETLEEAALEHKAGVARMKRGVGGTCCIATIF